MSEQFEMIAKTFQGLEEILAEELTNPTIREATDSKTLVLNPDLIVVQGVLFLKPKYSERYSRPP